MDMVTIASTGDASDYGNLSTSGSLVPLAQIRHEVFMLKDLQMRQLNTLYYPQLDLGFLLAV